MTYRTSIVLEGSSDLSADQTLALARVAHARKPSPVTRQRLAILLGQRDAPEEILALMEGASDLTATEARLLSSAWLGRQPPRANDALTAADLALTLSKDTRESSQALTQRARIEASLNDWDAARDTLTEALDLDPWNREACMRLAAIELHAGETGSVLALVDRLATLDVAHPYMLATQTLALARRGEIEAARHITPLDQLHGAEQLEPPDGWDDITTFNEALTLELLAHPDLRLQRYGNATRPNWGIAAPLSRRTPLLRILLDRIADRLAAHLARLAEIDHPWTRQRPHAATLHCSCVIAEKGGHDGWHVHPTSWLNGVYYLQIPEAIARGETEAGCIAFGLPDQYVGVDSAASYGTRTVRPQSGLMVTFPSHCYHRTFPHGLDQRRICLTFELRPAS